MARGPEAYRVRLQTLRDLPTFDGLSDDAIERIAEHVAEITIQPGAHLCRQGSPAMEAFIIVGGIAQLIADNTIVRDIERGELIGEIAVLSGKPRTVSVRALTKLEAFVLNAADVRWLMDEPSASGVVRQSVARHLGSDKERHPDPGLGDLARVVGGWLGRAVKTLRS
jgi:CRP-like cAMP-binding protein